MAVVVLLTGVRAFCPAEDVSSTRQFEGKPIASIRFDPPQQPLPLDYLTNILPVKIKAPFRMDEIRSAIERLFATGRYADISVAADPAPDGVAITFRTEDQWFVGRVDAAGNIKEPPNRGQVANAARLALGQPYTDDELKDAAENVRRLLRENGFYEATVEPKTARDPQYQQVNIVFEVHPGHRAHFAKPVITGQPVLKPDEVAGATKWKHWFRWKTVTQENVQSGIQNVRKRYQKHDRLSARIQLRGMDYDPKNRRVTPTLEVTGGPKIQVKTVGAKISKKKLRDYVPIYDEGTVDRDLLTEGARNLRDYYQLQGYFDVEVDFERQRIDPDHENIIYAVNLGRRQKVVKVEVQGNRYFSTDTVRERMYIQPAGLIRLRHGRYSAGFARRDESAIKSLYQSNGFRDVKVNAQTIDDYKGKRDEMAVIVRIDEGPQYIVSDFSLEGINQLGKADIVSMLASIPGEPFSESNVALDRNYLINTYNSSGFPEVTFAWTMKQGADPHQVAVQYTIHEGPRRYVREVLISGLHETSRRLIDPTLRLQPNDPLSLRDIADTQHNLYDLGIFDSVDTAVQNQDGDTDHKYVLYQIREGHRYALAGGFGAEFARIGGKENSWSSPGGQSGFSPRVSLNFSRLNMWGLGHSLNFKGKLSSLEQLASLNYLAPRYRNVDGRNISVTGTYDLRRDVRTFTGKRLEGATQLSQKWSKALTMLYRYSYRRVSVDPGSLKIQPLLIPLLSQPSRIGMVEADLIHDRRDDPTDARKGIYTTFDAGLATKVIGSQRSFARILATNSSYKTFHRNWTFARRLQLGWLGPFAVARGIDPVQSIPLPERFFGGGSTSHRGFPDNQAGPRDLFSGFPLGGNALLIHNTELRFPFLGDNIDGVFFHDMGNVYSSPTKVSFRVHQRGLDDFNYMVHAVGFGIRYRTPVGPVRVDLAYSMNPPRFFGFKGNTQDVLTGQAPRVEQGISHFQFFFSIGQAF